MKSILYKKFFYYQGLILIAFMLLTLCNELFDLSHYLFGDTPTSFEQRIGEILFEICAFSFIVIVEIIIIRNLIKRITYFEKRKTVLEEIFFHDVLNTAGVVTGYTEIIKMKKQDKVDKYIDKLSSSLNTLVEELHVQRDLINAEKGELTIDPKPLNSLDLLKEITTYYKSIKIAQGKSISINNRSQDITLSTDKTLLRRIITNMLKNAIEVSEENDSIEIGCNSKGEDVCFWVHNRDFIPENVQKHIFEYSFSTKGTGRGLGTYSMKLLAEKYLNGHVSFETSRDIGTTFKIIIPVQYKDTFKKG